MFDSEVDAVHTSRRQHEITDIHWSLLPSGPDGETQSNPSDFPEEPTLPAKGAPDGKSHFGQVPRIACATIIRRCSEVHGAVAGIDDG